jgi:hypothetical protein
MARSAPSGCTSIEPSFAATNDSGPNSSRSRRTSISRAGSIRRASAAKTVAGEDTSRRIGILIFERRNPRTFSLRPGFRQLKCCSYWAQCGGIFGFIRTLARFWSGGRWFAKARDSVIRRPSPQREPPQRSDAHVRFEVRCPRCAGKSASLVRRLS